MLDAKPVATPMAPHPKLSLHSGSVLDNPTQFRAVVGSLQYLSFTRPDIAYSVNRLSQFMHRPTDLHWQAAKRILRYLAGTHSHGDVDDFVSTNAFILYLGSTPLAWSSKKQTGVARSSTEAEYRSVANTAAEIRWVCSLLTKLGVQLPATPVIYCDNVGATYLSANPVFHSRMKHLALDFHFVRENVQSGALRVAFVSTKDQLADALTKPLPRPRFLELMSKIASKPISSSSNLDVSPWKTSKTTDGFGKKKAKRLDFDSSSDDATGRREKWKPRKRFVPSFDVTPRKNYETTGLYERRKGKKKLAPLTDSSSSSPDVPPKKSSMRTAIDCRREWRKKQVARLTDVYNQMRTLHLENAKAIRAKTRARWSLFPSKHHGGVAPEKNPFICLPMVDGLEWSKRDWKQFHDWILFEKTKARVDPDMEDYFC
ncbi:unnamed protein product [Microthlaspi erraticum]|uniref:Reverse transcriptase Ty1/copia-type domain-containing protein n=1 Tax=Microthlaspi erraticum TaxID=1685480 RepID=A0A6D2JX40_9BRAS|nr:unnamed protein product [Microthlaspi erraticum]